MNDGHSKGLGQEGTVVLKKESRKDKQRSIADISGNDEKSIQNGRALCYTDPVISNLNETEGIV